MIAVGRLRPPYADDVQHYKKLLAGHARLELVEVKDDAQVERRIPDRALHGGAGRRRPDLRLRGLQPSFLEQRRQSGMDLCFVIGGPRGHIAAQGDMSLSLGPMTLPHQLARVVLLEQLYRGHKILAREPYHY